MYGFSDWGLPEFTRVVAGVFDGQVLVGFMLKCLTFGLAVALIPSRPASRPSATASSRRRSRCSADW